MSDTLFVVVRRDWHRDYQHSTPGGGRFDGWARLEFEQVGVPVAVFADRESAERHRLALERRGRREVGSPARFDDGDRTSIEEGSELLDRIKQLGAPEPDLHKNEKYGYEYIDWATWWELFGGTLTDEQYDGIWELFDELQLYFIQEIEVEE